MKPTKIRVENFRSYESTDWIEFEDKLTIVGENNAGKSNLLHAFDEFFSFGSRTAHSVSDFHHGRTGDPIVIDVCFSSLSDDIYDSFGANVFENEFVIRAELPYDTELEKSGSKQYLGRKEVLRNDELRNIGSEDPEDAVDIYHKHSDILEDFKNDETCESRASVERVVDAYIDSGEAEVQKEWTSINKKELKSHMPEFSYFPADRSLNDATRTSNKSSLLSQLLRSAVSEIPEIEIEEINNSLQDIEKQLNSKDKFESIRKLEKNISTKLSMQIRDIESISIETGVPDLEELLTRNVDVHVNDANESLIGDIGSGSQMSFVLACLWELSERDTDSIIFALEEPENDLHPHAQRQLYNTLEELTEQDHTVLLSTHSPQLVTLNDIMNVARIEKRNNASSVFCASKDLFSEIQRQKMRTLMTTEKNEILFSRGILLCEGASERDAIPVLNETLSNYNSEIDMFDSRGISLVDVGGKKNMSMFAKIANEFKIPSVAILDDDREADQSNDDHEEVMENIQTEATEFIHLDEDLEFALFKCLSVPEYCKSMSLISPFDKSADEIQTAIEKSGRPKESVFDEFFNKYAPSKPQFGRAAVTQIQEDRVPENLKQAIKNTLQITEYT